MIIHRITPFFFLIILTTLAGGCFELEQPQSADELPDNEEAEVVGLTVEDACIDDLDVGAAGGEAEADGLRWLNCYRNLAAIRPVAATSDVNLAAERHAAYMVETGQFTLVETNANASNYSGYDTLDRLDSAGREVDLSVLSVYEAVTSAGEGNEAEPTRAIDSWINTVYHRAPLMRPLIDEVGLSLDTQFADLITVGPWDTEEIGGGVLAARYPVPGQGDVPADFDSDLERPDPAPDAGVVGSPITVTFQGEEWVDNDNHFDVHLVPEGCTVTSMDGKEVELILLEPATDGYLWATVVLLPAEPLEYAQTYQVEVDATVSGESWSSSWIFYTELD